MPVRSLPHLPGSGSTISISGLSSTSSSPVNVMRLRRDMRCVVSWMRSVSRWDCPRETPQWSRPSGKLHKPAAEVKYFGEILVVCHVFWGTLIPDRFHASGVAIARGNDIGDCGSRSLGARTLSHQTHVRFDRTRRFCYFCLLLPKSTWHIYQRVTSCPLWPPLCHPPEDLISWLDDR